MYLYDTCSKAPTEDAEDMSARPEERPGLATWKAIFQFWARWWHNFFMLSQFWYEGLDYGEFSGNSVNGILHKSTKCCKKRHFWWFPIQNSGLSRSDRNAIIGENSSKTMNFFDWFWSTMPQIKLRNLNQKILSTGNEPGKHAWTSLKLIQDDQMAENGDFRSKRPPKWSWWPPVDDIEYDKLNGMVNVNLS